MWWLMVKCGRARTRAPLLMASGSRDVMLGRGLVARPDLARQIVADARSEAAPALDWPAMQPVVWRMWALLQDYADGAYPQARLKQWLALVAQAFPCCAAFAAGGAALCDGRRGRGALAGFGVLGALAYDYAIFCKRVLVDAHACWGGWPVRQEKCMAATTPPHLSVLLVCMGNICRSPTAEAILRAQLRARGWQDAVHVDLGTHAYHVGEAPDARASEAAAAAGYVLEWACGRGRCVRMILPVLTGFGRTAAKSWPSCAGAARRHSKANCA